MSDVGVFLGPNLLEQGGDGIGGPLVYVGINLFQMMRNVGDAERERL